MAVDTLNDGERRRRAEIEQDIRDLRHVVAELLHRVADLERQIASHEHGI